MEVFILKTDYRLLGVFSNLGSAIDTANEDAQFGVTFGAFKGDKWSFYESNKGVLGKGYYTIQRVTIDKYNRIGWNP